MAATRAVLCLLSLVPGILSLRVTPGSPCTSVCANPTNTTTDEIVCLDSQYTSTTTGSQFQSCISCELQSVYGDQSTGETDVDWGLCFSGELYFLSSTPSLSHRIKLTCCDLVVLEAIRYNCHFQTLIGTAFPISPSRIFNSTELPTTTASLTTSSAAAAQSPVQKFLTVIIVFPIIGFLILVALTALCCFCLIRHRRKKAKERSYSHHLHARWNDTTISTPGQAAWGNFSPYQSPGAMPHQMVGSPGYGYGSGFDVVDSDGRRYDAGFSKTGFASYASPVSPGVPAPAQAFHPHEAEKPAEQQQTHFPPPPSQQGR
ncbi:hypothetical protein T310_9697 [Rasamsonia emersonii CBS 393.64]|uniref:Transmembrane protein n=1 Tax=Rasamsonia emersonii (strain ATCC 16479 / CBS 393.64 / IMI 116815) TaxID=1408163 RepID=A0A0F4YGF1_RASE3|nr:hypothetical protein T310_9697 [Rasamsonia emersonii CBS 393.64]KKA16688.1 hypothetical protein T310_9697 [Rasamsonia emersonii CBS 393.64]